MAWDKRLRVDSRYFWVVMAGFLVTAWPSMEFIIGMRRPAGEGLPVGEMGLAEFDPTLP